MLQRKERSGDGRGTGVGAIEKAAAGAGRPILSAWDLYFYAISRVVGAAGFL
jgi:hypothetical protein